MHTGKAQISRSRNYIDQNVAMLLMSRHLIRSFNSILKRIHITELQLYKLIHSLFTSSRKVRTRHFTSPKGEESLVQAEITMTTLADDAILFRTTNHFVDYKQFNLE
jgi:hypothetical protein